MMKVLRILNSCCTYPTKPLAQRHTIMRDDNWQKIVQKRITAPAGPWPLPLCSWKLSSTSRVFPNSLLIRLGHNPFIPLCLSASLLHSHWLSQVPSGTFAFIPPPECFKWAIQRKQETMESSQEDRTNMVKNQAMLVIVGYVIRTSVVHFRDLQIVGIYKPEIQSKMDL